MIMISHFGDLEIESERVYLVFDRKTGVIVHIHRVVTHRGANESSDEESEARALEMASRFGERPEKLRVLRTDKYDSTVPQRVNVKTLQLSPMTADKPRRPAKREAGKVAKSAASRRKTR